MYAPIHPLGPRDNFTYKLQCKSTCLSACKKVGPCLRRSNFWGVTLSFPSMKHRDVPKSTRFGKKPRNRQRNITKRMTKKQHYNSKSVLRGPATNWGHSFSSDIKGKHICHDCRKWGKVPVRLSSVESADRRNRKGSDGTVTHRYLHEVVFKHPATFDLLLLQRCHS